MGWKAALIAGSAAVVLCVQLGGCSSTPQALEASSEPVTQNFANPYEEIFQRVVSVARRCISTSSPAVTLSVEANLHKEAGFGEIRFVSFNDWVSNYFVSAKVERAGAGSRMTVRAGNTITTHTFNKRVLLWAGGATECTP